MKSQSLQLFTDQFFHRLDIKKFYYQSKPVFLTVFFHLIIFIGLFSFAGVALKASNSQAIGSFNLISGNSIIKHSHKKTANTPKSDFGASGTINNNEAGQELSSSSEAIFAAKYLNNPYPQYPFLAKRRGEQGVVIVRAFIDQDGLVTKLEIAQSSSYSLLDNAAIEAIRKWQFIPAKRLGQNTASSVLIPINFKFS